MPTRDRIRAEIGRFAASLLLALGAIGVVELALRWVGPTPASRLAYQRLHRPVLASLGQVWGVQDPRMAYQELPKAGGLRIAVFGASAVTGLGFSPNGAFSRVSQAHLRAQGVDAHVLNLGLVGAASGQVLDLVQDAVATAAPDVVVVYSGNNEYLETISARFAARAAGPLDQLRLGLASLRVVGLAMDRLDRRPPPSELPRVSGAVMAAEVQLSSADHRRILERYADNLRAIAHSGPRVVLVPVQTNPEWAGATLRKASPQMAAVVAQVAASDGAELCELPTLGAPDFYDHIHFSPAGAARVGAAVAQCINGVPTKPRPRPSADPWAIADWWGLGADPTGAADPDLWKYDHWLATLDARLLNDPADVDALVQRGNGWFFERDGGPQAAALWTRALALSPHPAIQANLDTLAAQARSQTPSGG